MPGPDGLEQRTAEDRAHYDSLPDVDDSDDWSDDMESDLLDIAEARLESFEVAL